MKKIQYIDRRSQELKEEKVWGRSILELLYSKSFLNKIFGRPLNWLIAKNPFVSAAFGLWHKLWFTKNKIVPFVKKYKVDMDQFEIPTGGFKSFNDFFIRKLKNREIAGGENVAIIPADGRYLFSQNISKSDGFYIKGEKFNLQKLLHDPHLAKKYEHGTMLIGRLNPTDYHRFHFPIDCIPDKVKMINGYLFSVNPIAIRYDIHIFSKNKRALCSLSTENFGEVLYIEVGATNVGSINQTFTSFKSYKKGDEKGFFALGASSIILLFEPDKIVLDADLVKAQKIEIKCLMGQSLGKEAGF